MGAKIKGPVDFWHAAAVAKVLTTSFVAGDAVDTEDANEAWFTLETSGTLLTYLHLIAYWSPDGGSTYVRLPMINSVSGGVGDWDPGEFRSDLGGAMGDYSYGPFAVPPGCKIQLSAKMTGGAGDTKLLSRLHLVTV